MRGQRNTVRFFPHHGVAAFFVVAALTLMLSGCGLPTLDYLYPPAEFSQPSANLIILQHNSNNTHDDNGFNGYKIYYRVFDDYDNAESSYEYLSENLTSTNIATIASNKGYYPLLKEKSSDTSSFDYSTLIPYSICESETYDYFYLNMSANSTWTILGDSDTLYYVVRYKGASNTSDADFCIASNYEKDDQDYDGESDPSNIYIVFFAVAYGTSTTSVGVDIYSDPNEEGYVSIIGPYSTSYSPLGS